MPTIRLIDIDAGVLAFDHPAEDPAAFADGTAVSVEAELRPILEQVATLYQAKPRDARWGCFLTVDDAEGQVIGTCGYKDAPDDEGAVEIAYSSFAAFEGKGYATLMAAELAGRAGRNGAKLVVAHTLPEVNASGRILEKTGFRRVGEVVDPEDGLVWRWERPAAR